MLRLRDTVHSGGPTVLTGQAAQRDTLDALKEFSALDATAEAVVWKPELTAAALSWPSSLYDRYGKRVLDLVGASALLVALSPLLLGTWLVVLFALGRPALFRQQRVGRGGEVFTVLKFRTMHPDRRAPLERRTGPDRRRHFEQYDGPERRWRERRTCDGRRQTHKSDCDPRHHTVGRVLRRLSLDELPQLFNVLRGNMSLVGPRPELVEVVRRYYPWQHRRHVVKPGITGWWQVSARGDRAMHEATDVDLEYLPRVSFITDVAILLKTIPATIRRTGA